MMIEKYRNKLPTYFGCFIIFAMLPQIIGFNGSAIDTGFKFLLIGVLTYLVINPGRITKVSKFFFFFLMISFIGMVCTIICNGIGIFNEIQSWAIQVLLLYILYECILHTKKIKSREVLWFYKICTEDEL